MLRYNVTSTGGFVLLFESFSLGSIGINYAVVSTMTSQTGFGLA